MQYNKQVLQPFDAPRHPSSRAPILPNQSARSRVRRVSHSLRLTARTACSLRCLRAQCRQVWNSPTSSSARLMASCRQKFHASSWCMMPCDAILDAFKGMERPTSSAHSTEGRLKALQSCSSIRGDSCEAVVAFVVEVTRWSLPFSNCMRLLQIRPTQCCLADLW